MAVEEIMESGICFSFLAPPILADKVKPDSTYKSVDFIFELAERIIFVEVKNFTNPIDHEERQDKKRGWSLRDILIYKYRDTLLWRYFRDEERRSELMKKCVIYVALLENLPDKRDYMDLESSITSRLPIRGLNRCGFCDEFNLLTVAAWNMRFCSTLGGARLCNS